MKITLARALKLKNRVQSRIRQISNDLSSNNSVLKGSEPDVNVAETIGSYDQLVDYLIGLKADIFRTNDPVYEKILRLAEVKSKIGVLRSFDTKHGKVADKYSMSDPLEYEATFRKAQVDEIVRGLEQQVDILQEELDNHNHTTYIEVESIDF